MVDSRSSLVVLSAGRWKPSHYALRQAFADVIAACGVLPDNSSACYVRNDSPWPVPKARLQVSLLHLGGSSLTASWLTPVAEFETAIPSVQGTPAGAEQSGLSWFCADGTRAMPCPPFAEVLQGHGCAADGADCLIQLEVSCAGVPCAENLVALAPPKELRIQATEVTATVTNKTAANATATIVVTSSTAVAAWVVLTSSAHGRFSEQAFFVRPDAPRSIAFVPFEYVLEEGRGEATLAELEDSLRVESLWSVVAAM